MVLEQIDSRVYANGSMEVTFFNVETGDVTTEFIDAFYLDDDLADEEEIPHDVLAEMRVESAE